MARPGRKRKQTARRRATTLDGRGQGNDYGTIETQIRRAEATGAEIIEIRPNVGKGGKVIVGKRDPKLSEYWIGRLYAAELISEVQKTALDHYQSLAWAAAGKPFPKAIKMDIPVGYEGDPDSARKALMRIERDVAKLTSRSSLDAAQNIAVYDRKPRKIEVERNDGDDVLVVHRWAGLVKIRKAAECMAELFGYKSVARNRQRG